MYKVWNVIPKTPNPLESLEAKKNKQDEYWDEIIEGFEERIRLRAKRNRERYAETLCKCGYDEIKCKAGTVKCD